MTHVVCEWYLTLCLPLKPTQYWNYIHRTWVDDRREATRYGTDRRSVNRALGQRRRFCSEHERHYLDIAYLSVPQFAINCT